MQLRFRCPACQTPQSQPVNSNGDELRCVDCQWRHTVTGFTEAPDVNASANAAASPAPNRCLVCGCEDLWRQKDFPQKLGLIMVATAALFSTIAWSLYRPGLAIAVLMGFALIDLLLFVWMKDMLVCYRCGSQHGRTAIRADHPKFDLELNERYRQEAIRLEQSENRPVS